MSTPSTRSALKAVQSSRYTASLSAIKNFLLLTCVGITVATTLGCQQNKPKNSSEAAAPAETWQSNMTGLSVTLIELVPYLTDASKFNDPKNSEYVTTRAKKLAVLAAKVNENQKAVGNDPTVGFIAAQFSDDTQRAVDSLGLGHRDYALHLLKDTTSYCIQCHTRTNIGPAFNRKELENSLSTLHPLQKGEFYTALREFDRALDEFEKVIKAPRAQQPNVFTWDKASRYALAISVKFLADPKKSMEVINLILSSENAPYFLKQDARVWKEAVLDWTKEAKVFSKKPKTLLAQAQSLIDKAQKKQKFSSDHAADIYYLRAASILHNQLSGATDPQERAQAIYLEGICYESLKDLNFWSIDERYFETCVRTAPHSEIAKKCYQKYEENVYFGYTGSSGLSLPPDIQKSLDELKALAN